MSLIRIKLIKLLRKTTHKLLPNDRAVKINDTTLLVKVNDHMYARVRGNFRDFTEQDLVEMVAIAHKKYNIE